MSNAGSMWQYKETVDKSCKFLKDDQDKKELFKILRSTLKKVISRESEKDKYSYIWRETIENSKSQTYFEIKDILMDMLRDLAKSLIDSKVAHDDVLTSLDENEFIFKRLKLYLINSCNIENLIQEVFQINFLEVEENLWHEYSKLLESKFSLCKDKEGFFDRLFKLNDLSESIEPHNSVANRRFINKVCSVLCEWVPDRYKSEQRALIEEFGQYKEVSLGRGMVHCGPSSPLQKNRIESMSVKDIAEYLDRWKPDYMEKSLFRDSEEGLSRVLERCITENFQKFILNLDLLKLKEKTYIGVVIRGLSLNMSEFTVQDWERFITYLEWVVSVANDYVEPAESSLLERDMSWRPTRMNLLRSISSGLNTGKKLLPFTFRSRVLKLINSCFQDADPQVVEEDKFASNGDYFSNGINSVRSYAVETLIQYGIWISHNSKLKGRLPVDQAPELFSILESRLSMRQEQSLSVLAIYGRWLPRLHYMNEKWVQEYLHIILPLEESRYREWKAVWLAEVLYNPAYGNIAVLCRESYLKSISCLSFDEEFKSEKVQKRISGHIALLYVYGFISLKDDMLLNLYKNIDEQLRKYILSLISKNFLNERKNSLTKDIERAKALWKWRFETGTKEELATFGSWFEIEYLEIDWLVENLKMLSERGVELDSVHYLLERLNKEVYKNVELSVQALGFVASYQRFESPYLIAIELEKIIGVLLNTTHKAEVRRITNLLGVKGFPSLGKLLD